MCVGDVEHMNHLFIDCKYAKECWQGVGLNFEWREEEYAHDWLLNMLTSALEDTLIKVVTVLWGVWFSINKSIFEGKNISPSIAFYWSQKQIVEWQIANRRKLNSQDTGANMTRNDHKWKPPEVNQLKINVNASVMAGQSSFAIGLVIRNHQG